MRLIPPFILLPALLGACSGNTAILGALADTDAGGERVDDAGGERVDDAGAEHADGAPHSDAATGPRIAITVASSIAPYTHGDGLQGQTPETESLGIRSLVLYRGAADTTGVTVFDKSSDFVEAVLLPVSSTVVGSGDFNALAGQHFTRARIGISHVRYKVATLVHSAAGAAMGLDDAVEVLSKDVTLDGTKRQRGYYKASFVIGGVPAGMVEGQNAPVPENPAAGGITLDHSGPECYYGFDINLDVPAALNGPPPGVTFTVNVTQSFRWSDEKKSGYQTGVWDTEVGHYEPVLSFGANSFSLSLQPGS